MPRNRLSSQYRYAGRVYDGPCEGDYIEEHSPHYLAVFTLPISASIQHLTGDSGVVADRALYRWSRDIRAWVWVQS